MSKLNKANSQNDTLQNYLLEKDNELIKLQEQIDVHIKEFVFLISPFSHF